MNLRKDKSLKYFIFNDVAKKKRRWMLNNFLFIIFFHTVRRRGLVGKTAAFVAKGRRFKSSARNILFLLILI